MKQPSDNLTIPPRTLPTPDPAWDYARIWEILARTDEKLAMMLTDLAKQENATPGKIQELQRNLMLMAGALMQTAQLLGEEVKNYEK